MQRKEIDTDNEWKGKKVVNREWEANYGEQKVSRLKEREKDGERKRLGRKDRSWTNERNNKSNRFQNRKKIYVARFDLQKVFIKQK